MHPSSQASPSPLPAVAQSGVQILNSPARLRALVATKLLDTPPEAAFDRLTALAYRLLKTSVSLVSLVDTDRQFFKSAQGLAEPWASRQGTPLSHSFCQYVVTSNAPLIVEDAREDAQLCNNLAIPDLHVIAYLGVPLHTPNGQTIGALCVIDDQPRVWSQDDIQTLSDLAELVMTEIAMRQYLEQHDEGRSQLQKNNALLQGIIDSIGDGISVRDVENRYLLVNQVSAELVGMRPEAMIGRTYDALFPPEIAAQIAAEDQKTLETGKASRTEYTWTLGQAKKTFDSTRYAYRDAQGNTIGIIGVSHDITEQKQLEEKLTYHADLLDNMHDAVIATDTQFNITAWNRGAEQMYGWTFDEVLGRPVREVIRSEISAELRQQAMQDLQTSGRYRMALITHYKDGRAIHTESVTVALDDESATITGYLSINRDISERSRAEEAIRQTTEQLQRITDNVPGLIAYVDRDERYRFVNATYESWYGKPAAQILDRKVREFVRPETYAKAQPYIAAALAGEAVTFEVDTFRNDKPVCWLMKYTPHHAPNGEVLGFYTLTTDITAYKQAEAALHENEERFRATFEQAAVGMAHCDLKGEYTRVNNCLCETLGYSRSELLQKTYLAITHPDDLEASKQQIQHLLAKGEGSYTLEKRYLCKDGTYLWVKVTVSLARNHYTQRPEYLIGVVEDISKRKEYEQTLQELNVTLEERVALRSKQLQRSNTKLLESESKLRQLSQQLMQITEQERKRISREIHDQLGQALTALKMEIKGAQRWLAADHTTAATRLDAADKLIDETVGTVRRIAADLRPGVLDHFGLGPAVEWLMEQFEVRNQIVYELAIDIDPDKITPDMATAAYRILQEALTNVVRHAQASKVYVTITTEEEFIMQVRDNGRGLQETTTRRRSLGVLGMSERAQQFGGTVVLHGEQGSGAIVTLALPIRGKEKEKPA